MEELLKYAMLFAVLVIAVYVVVRVASYAHFRTKLEYFRSVKDEIGGSDDGEEG